MLKPGDLFDLNGLIFADLFEDLEYVWEALDLIKEYTSRKVEEAGGNGKLLRRYGDVLPRTVVVHDCILHESNFELLGGDPTKGQMRVKLYGNEVSDAAVIHAGAVIMDDNVHIGRGAKVEPGALIKGPTLIGTGSEVRQGAYLRGSCLVGKGCVVGHATEMKNSVMLDGAKAGHFAYLGDSILGRNVNLGAGTKLANLKIIDRPHKISAGDQTIEVARRKFGAIMGDDCETGCNSVTNPACIMGKRSLAAPCTSIPGGYHKPKTVFR